MIGGPSSSVSRGEIVRAVMSEGPPAANGTTIRIGLLGYVCECAVAATTNAAAAASLSLVRIG
jgi:hypothetical protein